MVQPLIDAINWFIALLNCMPFAIKAFIGLVSVLFVVSIIVSIIRH